jgi:acetate kinase
MATRSGSIDPGLLLYVLDGRLGRTEVEHALNHESGLLGVSGIAGGVREVEQAATAGDERAQLALAIFVRGVAGAAVAMSTALRGLDAVVFTSGVGEGSAAVRAAVAERLAHLGLRRDPAANADCRPDADVAAPDSPVRALAIAAGEELVIARHTRRVVDGDGDSEAARPPRR